MRLSTPQKVSLCARIQPTLNIFHTLPRGIAQHWQGSTHLSTLSFTLLELARFVSLIARPSKMAPNGKPMLSFEQLHPTFGAECAGVDFSKPLTEETIAEIRTGMAKYGVLVFRTTGLDDARHEAFARNFGEPDTSAVNPTAAKKHRLAPHMELTDAGNLDRDGNLVSRDSLRYQLTLGNGQFHVDCSYNARRAGYSILRAHELPPPGTCGGTAFADTRTAYHDLDSGIQQDIKDVVLWHSILHSRQAAAPNCEIINMLDAADLPMSRHKLVQLHEPSGRMNLYIASHAYSIQGKCKAESQPLIQRLLAHASQEKYVFRVNWQNNGDVVMWVSPLTSTYRFLNFFI
jgi:alpha-ketoglutarate-dependent 2,4-dichlorophenoxyacetate dioxygenase